MDTTQFIAVLEQYTRDSASGSILEGALLADVVQRITTYELAEGGPYGEITAKGVTTSDVGLNLVIAEFLRALEIQLPQLDAFLHASSKQRTLESVYLANEDLTNRIKKFVQETAALASHFSEIVFTESEQVIVHELRQVAAQRFLTLSPELISRANKVVEKTIMRNADKQIPLIGEYMRQALEEQGSTFSDRYLGEIGFNTLCFWASTIIYDDFWDEDEKADPQLLPVANLLAREYIQHYSTIFSEKTGSASFFNSAMDRLDEANEWETQKCRMKIEGTKRHIPEFLPDYGEYAVKFYPASGHMFGPIVMLLSLGYSLDSAEVQSLIQYFTHYLIAMQLNDDAHDWKEDMERGHISTAVVALLQNWQRKYPDSPYIDVDKDMDELAQVFWYEELASLCTSILEHCALSREALYSVSCITNQAPLEKYILRNERAAREALEEQVKSAAFVKRYEVAEL